MSNEFLSQVEVDALLKGVTGETDDAKNEQDASGSALQPGDPGRIVRGACPRSRSSMNVLRACCASGCSISCAAPRNTVGPVKGEHSEFVRNLVVPTNLNMVQISSLRGTALFIFDPNLVFLVVDNLFGGDGRFHTRRRQDFTQTEQRIIQCMLNVVFEDYEKSWKPVYPVKFEYVRSEMHTQFANIATPNEVVVTTTFNIELGTTGGEFHVCMPYAMIEPIRDILYSALQGDHMEVDRRWVRLLSKQVQAAEVELVANLGHKPVTLNQILNMQVGT